MTAKDGIMFSKLKIRTLKPPIKYIRAIRGTIEAAIRAILLIPPIITMPTKMLITMDVYKGFNPKLDSIVLEILSIWGILPEPKVLIKRQNVKMTPSHFMFKPFSIYNIGPPNNSPDSFFNR